VRRGRAGGRSASRLERVLAQEPGGKLQPLVRVVVGSVRRGRRKVLRGKISGTDQLASTFQVGRGSVGLERNQIPRAIGVPRVTRERLRNVVLVAYLGVSDAGQRF
jgi:hypothetical protein